jgi:hypothetical protein
MQIVKHSSFHIALKGTNIFVQHAQVKVSKHVWKLLRNSSSIDTKLMRFAMSDGVVVLSYIRDKNIISSEKATSLADKERTKRLPHTNTL